MRYIFLILSSLLILGCEKTTLEDQSNETIPNYSITISEVTISQFTDNNLIVLNDETFLIAADLNQNGINLLEITQVFSNDSWSLDIKTVHTMPNADLFFFEKWKNDYILGYKNSTGELSIDILNKEYQTIDTKNNYLNFVKTHYNDTDSITIHSVSVNNSNNQVLLGGSLVSFGQQFSCVLRLSELLNPIDVNTYFYQSYVSSIHQINPDTFLLLNSSPTDSDLILDDISRDAYHKYNLSMDELYFSNQIDAANGNFMLTGVENEIGRTITVNLANESAFINDAEIYPVENLKAVFLSRNMPIVSGVQLIGSERFQWISELGSQGSIWCHRYFDENYISIIDIKEMPGKGIIVLSIIEENGEYFLHLTRIDEEGATFNDEYTENCL